MFENIPKSWRDITVSQFVELSTTEQSDFDTLEDFYSNQLSIVANIGVDVIEECPYKEVLNSLKSMTFLTVLPSVRPKHMVSTPAGVLYLLEDLYKMTVGEFIDLENLFVDGYIKNFQTILTILYRQKTIKNSLFELDEFEPYGNWIYHRAPLFNDVSIADVFGVVNMYLTFRTDILTRYEGLFDEKVEDEDMEPIQQPVDDPIMNKLSRAEQSKVIQREKSLNKWGWDLFILRLAGGDPLKIDQAVNIPLVQALNILSMKKELGLPD